MDTILVRTTSLVLNHALQTSFRCMIHSTKSQKNKYNERKVKRKKCTFNHVCDSQDFVVANGKDLKCG